GGRVPGPLGRKEAGSRVSIDREGADPQIHDAGDPAHLAVALAESEARYRAVVASLEEGITLHDASGRILDANPSAALILGVPAASLVGMTLTGLEWTVIDASGDPIPPDRHPLTIALATGEPSPIGLVGVHDAGRMLHWLQL